MKVLATLIFAFILTPLAAFAEEVPAKAERQLPPLYPEKCMALMDSADTLQRVAVTYDVSKNGLPENVRVRESSDPCFDDAAVAAVRSWTFEPRRIDGSKAPQTDLETVFIFKIQEETQLETFDARPTKRIPPRFPDQCQNRAGAEERVVVVFDVTESGETSNIRIESSTNSCFNRSAERSVAKWLYEPRLEDGAPVVRKNVQTVLVFRLGGRRLDPEEVMRPKVVRELNRAGKLIRTDAERALEMVAAVEAEFGDTFTAAESAAFHQIRGFARIGVNDARGALDDLRIARKRMKASDEAAAIETAISQLEAIVARQDAAVGAQNENDQSTYADDE